jgi:hypothetical protein
MKGVYKMKERKKVIVAIVITLVMVMSAWVPFYAAEKTNDIELNIPCEILRPMDDDPVHDKPVKI